MSDVGRCLAAVVALAAIAGCAPTSQDYRAVMKAALEQEGARDRIETVVLPADLSEPVVVATASMYRTMPEQLLPSVGRYRLPPRYFHLQHVEIDNDRARVVGHLGPLYRPGPDAPTMSCGTHMAIDLRREGAVWKAGDVSMRVC